ncbi:hypothetical protein UY3_05578 [Chelonia mydas]|uniref:RING-type domain-containing protein n=1 Tax=Chelonia mydas TaxID=8469 RepID=M7BJ96_CHEMY|nr:hypothetical protein UY3_05578 [Chelonia mydas]
MENSPGLLNPLASPALLVLASTSEGTRSTSTPCQQPRHFGVPVAMEKPSQLPFLGAAYSLVYPHPDRLAPASRDYPPQLLPLPPPFGHPSLERGGVGMLGYSALHPFTPFHLADDVEEAMTPLEDAQRLSQSPAISAQDGTDSPKGSPQAYEDGHKVDRQQTFLQVKSNREGRMGARAGRFKRIRPCLEEQMEGPLPTGSRLAEAEDEFSDESRCGGYEYRSPKKNVLETKDCRLLAARSSPSQDSDEADMDSEGEELPAFAKQTKVEEEEGDSTLTVELLKAQIQGLRRRLLRKDSYKCHICLDSYSVPLTSIQCWHIHCEQCWLRTLGSKKLCPQCNAITSPADLRRVFF